MTTFRLEAQDEFPHALETASNFNESVYCNMFDPERKMGGWMRLGNRANEGYAELSVCLYLPDGRLACQFLRPPISDNDRFEAGGLVYAVAEPFKTLSIGYEGSVYVLENAGDLADPKSVFTTAPRQPCRVDWQINGCSPMHGGEPTAADGETMYGRSFSRGHFNQHTRAEGIIRVGDSEWSVDGFGWRDHSWGPRYWQNIRFYRLLIANFGADAGLMALKITQPDGTTRRHGVLMREGRYEPIRDLDIVSDWTEDKNQRRISCLVRTDRGSEAIEGRVITLAPLRNRRMIDGHELRTRIAEGFTEWHWNGRTGLGMSEYLDLIDDGAPAGFPG